MGHGLGFFFFIFFDLLIDGLKVPILESWVFAFEKGISDFFIFFENVVIFYCGWKEKENV